MGEVRKRGRIYWLRYYRNGQRIEESARTTVEKVASDKLKRIEGAIASGAMISAQTGRYTFNEAADASLADQRANRRKTIDRTQQHVDTLRAYFGPRRRMCEITTADVRKYIDHRLQADMANGSINRELACLRRMFTLAVDAQIILGRPKIKKLVERNVRKGFFEPAQFAAVLPFLPLPLRGLACFLYGTGWRVGELIQLEWSRVDRKAGTIRLHPDETKNDEGREFPYRIIPQLAAVIEWQWAEHLRVIKDDRICPLVFHRDGKRIASFRKAWKSATTAAGCPERLVHDFRRTAVRNLEQSGVSRSVAMMLTGHKTASVYSRYAIVESASLVDGVRKLNSGASGTILGTIVGFEQQVEKVSARRSAR